jgi:hypothetical protein
MPKRDLVGSATTPAGAPASGVSVVLAPATPPAESFVKAVYVPIDKLPDVQPTSTSSITDAAGQFTLKVDAGIYDITLQPEAETGLPWVVIPRLQIADSPEQPVPTIAPKLKNPIVLEGVVVGSRGEPVEGAFIRAFITPPDADPTDTEVPAVIQIGEAVSDAGGYYRLLLPPSISQS